MIIFTVNTQHAFSDYIMQEIKKFDVALSFAEEDRDIALAISLAFEVEGLKTYYYPESRAEAWGADATNILTNIYAKEAKYAVVLFSESYTAEHKIYTKIELNAIRERMAENPDLVYMLPVQLSKHVSLSSYPDLERLIYIEWKYNAKEIARTVKELLGKELRGLDENAKPGNILYSGGDVPLVIVNSNIADLNQDIIQSASDNAVIVTKKDIEGLNITQINFGDPKDTRFPCLNCAHQLDGKDYGKIKCPNCGKINYIENPKIKARGFTSLHDTEEKEYEKIIAHIRNKIRDGEYETAYQFCLKAEEIAPGVPYTWEYFARVELLREIYNKDKSKKKSTFEIVKKIKAHIDKCKDFKIDEEEYDELLIDIANKIFSIEKARINTVTGRYNEEYGFSKWSRNDFAYLLERVKSFEICYGLYKDPTFLEEYIRILTQNHKWIVKRLEDDSLINLPVPISFNAVGKLNALLAKIKEHTPNYSFPEIPSERFKIEKAQQIQITSIKEY